MIMMTLAAGRPEILVFNNNDTGAGWSTENHKIHKKSLNILSIAPNPC